MVIERLLVGHGASSSIRLSTVFKAFNFLEGTQAVNRVTVNEVSEIEEQSEREDAASSVKNCILSEFAVKLLIFIFSRSFKVVKYFFKNILMLRIFFYLF